MEWGKLGAEVDMSVRACIPRECVLTEIRWSGGEEEYHQVSRSMGPLEEDALAVVSAVRKCIRN